MVHGELEEQPVEVVGRDARRHMLGQHVERLGRQPPGAAHRREALGPVEGRFGGAPALEGIEFRHRMILSERRM